MFQPLPHKGTWDSIASPLNTLNRRNAWYQCSQIVNVDLQTMVTVFNVPLVKWEALWCLNMTFSTMWYQIIVGKGNTFDVCFWWPPHGQNAGSRNSGFHNQKYDLLQFTLKRQECTLGLSHFVLSVCWEQKVILNMHWSMSYISRCLFY